LQGVGVGWVLCNELSTQRVRSFVMPLITNLFWVVGYCLTGVIAMYYPDWRTQLLIVNVPFILMFSYFWCVRALSPFTAN
jgi:hypothetical protein